MSISGHKLYGPKESIALTCRETSCQGRSSDGGGGQERSQERNPTHPLAVGLGAACRVARKWKTTQVIQLSRNVCTKV